jgi:hypothetical protein
MIPSISLALVFFLFFSGNQVWVMANKVTKRTKKITKKEVIAKEPVPKSRFISWGDYYFSFKSEITSKSIAAIVLGEMIYNVCKSEPRDVAECTIETNVIELQRILERKFYFDNISKRLTISNLLQDKRRSLFELIQFLEEDMNIDPYIHCSLSVFLLLSFVFNEKKAKKFGITLDVENIMAVLNLALIPFAPLIQDNLLLFIEKKLDNLENLGARKFSRRRVSQDLAIIINNSCYDEVSRALLKTKFIKKLFEKDAKEPVADESKKLLKGEIKKLLRNETLSRFSSLLEMQFRFSFEMENFKTIREVNEPFAESLVEVNNFLERANILIDRGNRLRLANNLITYFSVVDSVNPKGIIVNDTSINIEKDQKIVYAIVDYKELVLNEQFYVKKVRFGSDLMQKMDRLCLYYFIIYRLGYIET